MAALCSESRGGNFLMIAYMMVGIRDLEKTLEFYDPLFAEMNLDVC